MGLLRPTRRRPDCVLNVCCVTKPCPLPHGGPSELGLQPWGGHGVNDCASTAHGSYCFDDSSIAFRIFLVIPLTAQRIA
jgi:hypothetical protein